jgi:uncharacterized membrane protein
MKTIRIIYWVTTVLVALTMVYSATADLTNPEVIKAFDHLGFPGYFRIELGIMKIIGIVLLLAPLPRIFKDWAYAGFAITFVSACIAHTASGDPIANRIAPIIILIVLLVSAFTYHRILQSKKTQIK